MNPPDPLLLPLLDPPDPHPFPPEDPDDPLAADTNLGFSNLPKTLFVSFSFPDGGLE